MGLRGPGARGLKARQASQLEAQAAPAGPKPWQAEGLTRAERVRAFIETLKVTSGVLAGQNLKLRDWQWERIVKPMYEVDAGGQRIVRHVLLTLPRKNGKTQLAAALALCHLVGPEAEPRGQVVSGASDRKQATLIFREMVAMILADPELSDRVNILRHSKVLEDLVTGSTYEALSSDARRAHGLSTSFVVMDELAQWLHRDLYDALVTAGAARASPLYVVISTQSHNPNHVMSELVQYGRRVADGTIPDPSFLPVIYAAPEDADPWAEETWRACNPALGDFRSLEELRTAADQARALPAREPAFRLLYLNQPVDAETRFLNARDWRACQAPAQDDAFGAMMLTKQRCILGLDLSSTTDLTALVAWFPTARLLKAWFWMPADNLEEAERRDRVPYLLWARQGLIEATPGRAIDKRFVVHRMGELTKDYQVEACAADRWRLDEIERLMADAGVKIKVIEHGQGWKDMGPAIDAFETAVLRKELRHPGHSVLDMCVANAQTVTDPTGARKLVKAREHGRIDGLVAAVMAIGAAAKMPAPKKSVYATRGLVSVKVA